MPSSERSKRKKERKMKRRKENKCPGMNNELVREFD